MNTWKVSAFSLATTLGVAYILCAIFDALYPPYGLLAVLAPASPWPLSGGLRGSVTGIGVFMVAGFVLGALHGSVSGSWRRILR